MPASSKVPTDRMHTPVSEVHAARDPRSLLDHLKNYNDHHSPDRTYLSTSQCSSHHDTCTTLMGLSLDLNISSYPTIITLAGGRNFRWLTVYARTYHRVACSDISNPVALQPIHAMVRSWLQRLTSITKGATFESIKIELLVEVEPTKEDGETVKPAPLMYQHNRKRDLDGPFKNVG